MSRRSHIHKSMRHCTMGSIGLSGMFQHINTYITCDDFGIVVQAGIELGLEGLQTFSS